MSGKTLWTAPTAMLTAVFGAAVAAIGTDWELRPGLIVAIAGIGLLAFFSFSRGFLPNSFGPAYAWLAAHAVAHSAVIPSAGFFLAGGTETGHLWAAIPALVVPSLTFGAALFPHPGPAGDPEAERRSVRLVTALLIAGCLSGTAVSALVLPGGPEIRLLGLSAAAVVAMFSAVGLFYPDPVSGRNVVSLIVRLWFLTFLGGTSAVYLLV